MAEMTAAEIELEIKRIELQTRQLELEEARENNERRIAVKADNKRKLAERMGNLRSTLINNQLIADQCSHKQGGSPANPYGGDGDTALKVVKMPDGFTSLIMCAICRLRVWSPNPANGAKALKKDETPQQQKARLRAFKEENEEFVVLLKESRKAKSPEFTRPMDCGNTITTRSMNTGMPTQRPRPCDSYAKPPADMLENARAAAAVEQAY